MKLPLCYAVVLSFVSTLSGQQASSPQPVTASPGVTATEAEPAKAPNSASRPASTSFSERLNKILRESQAHSQVPESTFTNNYQIQVDYRINGKSSSFSIVTADATFSYQGLGKEAVVGGVSAPLPVNFQGQLRKDTHDSIVLEYSLDLGVAYATSSYGSGSEKSSPAYVSIQQLTVGMKSAALFQLGKPLKIVESDGTGITITIDKMKNQ